MAFSYSVIANHLFNWASWNASSRMHASSVGHGPFVPGKFGVRYHKDSNSSTISTTMSSNLNSKFMQVYESLKSEIIHDPLFEFDEDSRKRVELMIDYNVPGGKMVRGFSVVDSFQLLKGEQLTDDEIFLACALGWCNEWFQAFLLVHDDIIDGSHTRRGHPCWHRLPEVGMTAVNDAIVLRNHTHRILKKHFQLKTYYVHLLELFNEAEFLTIYGQMIDVVEKDLSKYSLRRNRRIIQYKSGYYSLYLPVGCAFLMYGINLDDLVQVKNILVELGIYYQLQNDYLDMFGDPDMFGKSGTDITEFKCSWLIAKALELANDEQKKILKENYGTDDPSKVEKVKEVYRTLNLKGVYEDYEKETHDKLVKSIEAQPSKAVQAVLKSCIDKLYKGHKST